MNEMISYHIGMQMLRTNMQQRELAQRVLEHRLDQREESLLAVQETHRLEVNALKRAVRSLCDMTDEDDHRTQVNRERDTKEGTGSGLLESLLSTPGSKNADISPGERLKMQLKLHHTATAVAGAMKRKAAAKKRGTVTINQKLSQLSEKV